MAILVTPGAVALGSGPSDAVTTAMVGNALAVNAAGLSGVGPLGTVVDVPDRPTPRSPFVPPPWVPGPPPWQPGRPPWVPGPPPWVGG